MGNFIMRGKRNNASLPLLYSSFIPFSCFPPFSYGKNQHVIVESKERGSETLVECMPLLAMTSNDITVISCACLHGMCA